MASRVSPGALALKVQRVDDDPQGYTECGISQSLNIEENGGLG